MGRNVICLYCSVSKKRVSSEDNNVVVFLESVSMRAVVNVIVDRPKSKHRYVYSTVSGVDVYFRKMGMQDLVTDFICTSFLVKVEMKIHKGCRFVHISLIAKRKPLISKEINRILWCPCKITSKGTLTESLDYTSQP